MKTSLRGIFYTFILFACAFHLRAADSTNSDLFGSVSPIEKLRQAAENGDLDAQLQLAKQYRTGDGVPKNPAEAFKWMQMAAQNKAQSTRVNDATYELGLMYENGEGVQTNLLEARNLIFQAAADGQPDACFLVGQMYEKGDGVSQDDYQATKHYYNAMANMGGRKYRSQAAENLLKLYAEGRGLSKTNQEPQDYLDQQLADKKSVVQYLQKEITTPRAEFYAGKIYYQGTLVSQDLVEAAVEFQLAQEGGSVDAGKSLAELEPKLSPAQKNEVKRRAMSLRMHTRSQSVIDQIMNQQMDQQ